MQDQDLQWYQQALSSDRQISAAGDIFSSLLHLLSFHQDSCIGLVHSLVISAQTQDSYCNSSPDQTVPAPCSSQWHTLHTQKESKTDTSPFRHFSVGPQNCSQKMSSSPYWSSSKARKCMMRSGLSCWQQRLKGQPGSIFQINKRWRRSIRKNRKIMEGDKRLITIHVLIDPSVGTISSPLTEDPPSRVNKDWWVKQKWLTS